VSGIGTSAALFEQLRKLIPSIPAHVSELTLTLKHDDLPVLSVLFWPERPAGGTWPADQERKTFRLVEVDQGLTEQGLSKAHPQPGPSA
jgi:hypothetical protein